MLRFFLFFFLAACDLAVKSLSEHLYHVFVSRKVSTSARHDEGHNTRPVVTGIRDWIMKCLTYLNVEQYEVERRGPRIIGGTQPIPKDAKNMFR